MFSRKIQLTIFSMSKLDAVVFLLFDYCDEKNYANGREVFEC